MSRFVTKSEHEDLPSTAEALFRSLTPTDSSLKHLWAHQADLLREYQNVADEQNVALELPTGAGKTLVGLLIGELRRRARAERVAYLCPTVQLAKQAGAKASAYGIPHVVLTGSNWEWSHRDFQAFNRANAVAIATYAGVFNTNPRIIAQTLVLDDAHSAEGPVANLWSVQARRNEALYGALVDCLASALPPAFAERLTTSDVDPRERKAVELVPLGAVAERADAVREALQAHATGHNTFSRMTIGSSIGRCLVYLSWQEVLIRPLIPPTEHHRPFSDATQRIYMSATLGSGGELERAFGVEQVTRLPIPQGWDENGTGRRFFIFPGASFAEDWGSIVCSGLGPSIGQDASHSTVLGGARRRSFGAGPQ
jgi:hypothetical protein